MQQQQQQQQESQLEESAMKSSDSSQSSVGQGQLLNQEDQDHMALLENILSIPSWSELGVRNWEYESTKLTKPELSALLHGGGEKQSNSGSTNSNGKGGIQENVGDPQIGDIMVDDAFLFAQLQQQRSMLNEGVRTPGLDMVPEHHQQHHMLQQPQQQQRIGVPEDLSMLSSGPRPEAGQQQTMLSPSWRAPFMGGNGGIPPLGLQSGSEMFLRDSNPNGGHQQQQQLYNRSLEMAARDGSQGVMFYPPIPQPVAPPQQGNSNKPGAGAGAGPGFRPQPPITQPQPVNPIPGAAPRPRVRARRGQATDPHSIAERLRRERIAERMKALQDLVPNANKTDKASMLDEIVDYVKFLQLQVKVLSMSRLGGAGPVPSLVADLPAEGANSLLASTLSRSAGISHDGLASAERQVARLMDEDMGSAMQYLQSKGLCLMPISLAAASGKVPLSALQAIGSGNDNNKQFSETPVAVATDRSSSAAPNTSAAGACAAAAAAGNPGKMKESTSKDSAAEKSSEPGRQLKSPKTKPSSCQ